MKKYTPKYILDHLELEGQMDICMKKDIKFVAWNNSKIRCHFKFFVNLLNYVNHLQQPFDHWTVEVYDGDKLIDTKLLSEFQYYREEDGHINQGFDYREYYKCDICPDFECVGCNHG